VFPYDHILAGIAVLIVGFAFHWCGQLVSVLNWNFATKLGLQEKKMLPEYKVYEHAIAMSDVAVGWLYAVAGIGLLLGTPWGFKLAFIPGAILLYHSLNAWFWEGNRRKAGHGLWGNAMRFAWCSANFLTGAVAILVGWTRL
jgi:hypothetical protein